MALQQKQCNVFKNGALSMNISCSTYQNAIFDLKNHLAGLDTLKKTNLNI